MTLDLKICLVLSELRPGGMERLVVHLANGLAKRNLQVLVVCLENQGLLASNLDRDNIEIIALKSFGGKDIKALWKLNRILRHFKPSLINVHDYSSLPYIAIAGFFLRNTPIVFTAHGLLYEGFESLKKRYRFFSKALSGLTAVSEAVSKRHREYLDWTGDIQIIPNGVPAFKEESDHRERLRKEFLVGKKDVLFLAVGNPRPEKGFEDLIEAAVILKKSLPEQYGFKIVVAGKTTDSPYCRMLEKKLEESGLGRSFKFLGFRDDTAALYNATDVFVLSSRSEGLPMVILEAMMARLPVIATRVGGIPQMAGDNAFLVDSQAPEQLAEAMKRCIENPEETGRIAKLGYDLVSEKYGIDAMVSSYIGYYQIVLDKL